MKEKPKAVLAAVSVLQGRLNDCMMANLWPVTFSLGRRQDNREEKQ